MGDLDFSLEFTKFNEGLSPLAHIDNKTFVGNNGQASEMIADIITRPGFLTQGPALADLTNGNQAGVVDELIRFIMDQPVSATTTYGIGTSKLFKISPTEVISGGSPSFPQTISGMTSGESVIRLKANIYAFYNTASAGDIAKMPITTETIDATWGSVTGGDALENAPHPSAAKEDILLFGNGRYVGAYIEGAATLDAQKLDFGEGSEVVDIVYSANMWWIAVNSGESKRAQIYLYDGSAISNLLSDETGVGEFEIGFLYVHSGAIFVAYKDLTSNTYTIGFISGRIIKPLRYFSGTLPDHRQKALYRNTILFISNANVWSFGASVEQLSLQISTLCDGGYDTVGAIASPFGTPMVASLTGATSRLAKFSGYNASSSWKSIFTDTTQGRLLGKIHTVIVTSKPLGANAKCDISLEGNQGSSDDGMTSNTLEYTGTGKTRQVFRTINMKSVEDLRVVVDFSGGDATNDCPIRKIECLGTYNER